MTAAYVALGSNVGDRLLHLAEARRRLDLLGERTAGPVVQSEAVVPRGERFPHPPYLNTVDRVETRLGLDAFFDALMRIETEMGRVRTTRWAPRTIDLDLILFGDVQRADARLTVPHPRMHERPFVMGPLRALGLR